LIKLKEPNIGKQYKTLPQQSRVLLKRWQSLSQSRNSPLFMETEGYWHRQR